LSNLAANDGMGREKAGYIPYLLYLSVMI